MGKCDTSILGNLPKPSPRPLTDPTAVPSIHPSHALSQLSQNPLTQAPVLPMDLAVCPASLPPTPITHKIPTQFLSAPLEARRRFRAGNGKSPAFAKWPILQLRE